MSESLPRNAPDAWWLLAGPVTGLVSGTVLGAVLGWLTTPAEGVGPLVGNSVGSTILGAVVAAVCCPAVLLLLASIGRVELSQLGIASLAVVAVAGAVAFAWVAGCSPDRA